jgi:hypothetical protein
MTIEHPVFSVGETFEPHAIQDTFCEALVRIERIGSCRRLVFVVTDNSDPERSMRAVVAKLVLPAEQMAELAQAIVADDRSEHGGPVARLPVNAVAH